MQILISRMTNAGTWPTVGTTDRLTFQNIQSERDAMRLAIRWAQGRSYRIEFFQDGKFYGEPFKVLEQAALPFQAPAKDLGII